MKKHITQLKEISREIQLLNQSAQVLGWDQETYMPPNALEERGEQQALIQSIAHQKLVSEGVQKSFDALNVSKDQPEGQGIENDDDRAFVREFYKDHYRAAKIPESLVADFARKTSKAQAIWAKARKEDRFSDFAPALEEIVSLCRQKADHLGWTDSVYDPLIDEFEPGMTAESVKSVFDALRKDLSALLKKIASKPAIDASFLTQRYPVDQQQRFAEGVLSDMGYDLKSGRCDSSTHPFTATLGFDDVRITARYDQNFFNTGLYSIIHEGGHALYEQGFDPKYKGSLLGNSVSLGIHESQSRFWENIVGRGLPFWNHYYSSLQKQFPSSLGSVSQNDFYRGINDVRPSFIRIEADEVTYNLHIILRFELELKLLSGELSVDQLPEAWNAHFEDLFGIQPETNGEGCLQDIHWSIGIFGYFPTYALGNLYSAQLYHQLLKDIPDFNEQISAGQLKSGLDWMRSKIHQYGRKYTAGELIRKITGEDLNADYFMSYLTEKYSKIYDL